MDWQEVVIEKKYKIDIILGISGLECDHWSEWLRKGRDLPLVGEEKVKDLGNWRVRKAHYVGY